LRIDGVLHDSAEIEKDKWKKIITRLKVLARVKINITDKPQDGRFTIFYDQDKIEVRVSFLRPLTARASSCVCCIPSRLLWL